MKFLQKLKNKYFPKKYNDVSDFFHNATPEEKVALLKRVARKANEDQRKMMAEFNKLNKSQS